MTSGTFTIFRKYIETISHWHALKKKKQIQGFSAVWKTTHGMTEMQTCPATRRDDLYSNLDTLRCFHQRTWYQPQLKGKKSYSKQNVEPFAKGLIITITYLRKSFLLSSRALDYLVGWHQNTSLYKTVQMCRGFQRGSWISRLPALGLAMNMSLTPSALWRKRWKKSPR